MSLLCSHRIVTAEAFEPALWHNLGQVQSETLNNLGRNHRLTAPRRLDSPAMVTISQAARLTGVAERVSLLRGASWFGTTPDHHFRVEVTLPWE